MPEVVKRIGPMRLVFNVINDPSEDGFPYGMLGEIAWDGSNETLRMSYWRKNPLDLSKLFEAIEKVFCDDVAASDAAREAIERERLDLQREDAERFTRT